MVPPSILDAIEDWVPPSSPRRMTEDEFVAWALAGEERVEWVNGVVVAMPPSVPLKHTLISGWLHQTLGLYIAAKKLGELLGPQLMVRLQHAGVSRRVPDLLFVSQAKRGNLRTYHLEGPPDLAIEIVSFDSVGRDWHVKQLEYEAAGVSEYWIIDPDTDSFNASLRNSKGKFVPMEINSDGVLHSVAVPGFWFKLDWFWQTELPDIVPILRKLSVW